MLCSVCIATYKRPKLLNKLLDSLNKQILDESISIEIIIIDNDFKGSAKTVLDRFIASCNFSVSYNIQPEKNISLTRNMAVDKAKGEYIFFIDDDEYADENWMYIHINNLLKYNSDGAFGQVRSYFSSKTPEWIKNCYVYGRNINPSGEPPANLNIDHCFIRKEIFHRFREPFDPAVD